MTRLLSTGTVDEAEVLCRKAELTCARRTLNSPAGKIERSADASRIGHDPLVSLLKVKGVSQIHAATRGTKGSQWHSS